MDIFASVRSRSIKLRSNISSSQLTRSNTADYGSLYWKFNPNNHCLSARLTEILYGKWMVRAVGTSLILEVLISFSGGPLWIEAGYYVLIKIFLWIPYMFALILSMNRDALGFIIKSSEYWIKIVYAAIASILSIILTHHEIKQETNEIPAFLGYTVSVVAFFNSTMFMAIVGGTDAIPKMTFKWKAFIGGLLAFIYSFLACLYCWYQAPKII